MTSPGGRSLRGRLRRRGLGIGRPTGRAGKRCLILVACCVVGLAVVPVAALGDGVPVENAPAVDGGGASSVLGSSLVIVGSPTESEELRARSAVRRSDPEAFAAREQSRTKYEELGDDKAARVDRAVFSGLIEQRAGGTPHLPAGVRLVRYSGPTTAQLELPGGKHGALESTSVIAKPAAGGRFAPVDLGLERSGKDYRPKEPLVAVKIPVRLSEGVTAPTSGVSLVPTDSRGIPVRATEGSLQGASVLYVNSAVDTDTLAKPMNTGFELDAILRSERSPRTLYYQVRIPHGARLARHSDGQVEVIGAGGRIGYIPSPMAQDASGAAVPVTMRLVGDTLVVEVNSTSDELQWPIEVDPEYWEDDKLSPGWSECPSYGVCTYGMHNWEFITSNPQIFEMAVNFGYFDPIASYKGGEYAGVQYKTQGESKIWAFESKTLAIFGYNDETNVDLIKPQRNNKGEIEKYVPENERALSSSETSKEMTICGVPHTETHYCEATEGYPENIARFITYTTAAGTPHSFVGKIEIGHVYISQEKGPEPSYNTGSPTITVNGTTRPNVLYGSGTWLSAVSGAVGVSATDPGVGVSAVRLEGPGSLQEVNIHREGKCLGLKCEKAYTGSFTYSPRMANGEHSFRLTAEDGVDATGSTEATIKVDGSKPYNLGFTGIPEVGAEISAAPHTLTVHATDGKTPTPSSGIRATTVSLDGATPTELSGASCSPGPCTATGTYTIYGESLPEGVHRLAVSAVSNSGEPEAREFTFDVRHASPVSVGPGSVDPTTGQFTLTADDVSLGGASGVSRSYQSRDLTAGATGSLGPQWAMSVGGGEGLEVLPSANVVLTSSSGGQTTFALNSKNELEAPKGDENLKLEYNAPGHKYVLKNADAGSETTFEQPAGTQSIAPAFGDAFGAEAGVLNRPVSDALDSSGDLWITDWADSRIAEYSRAGTLIATYGSEGAEAGQFYRPWGIAVNQSTGNVYVTDDGNSRIVELSSTGAFIRAIGWGVSDDKPELETCASSCLAGIAGTGTGQLDGPQGISIDSSGNLWVAEYSSNRVQEFSETGSWIKAFGSAGTAGGQFEGPMNIAFAGGGVYITDQNNNRVDEFSTSGGFIKAIGWDVSKSGGEKLEMCASECKAGTAGTGNGQFNGPRGLTIDPVSGNLYVSEIGNNRVQEITTSGVFVSKFGSGGSGPGQFAQPMGVAVASTGAIYVTDFEHASVQEWMRPTWWSTSAKGSLASGTTYVYAPVENSEGTTSMYPSEVLSPPPHGVECGTKTGELKEEKDKGCRALTFKYATETTAAGEKRSEWGEYKGHLSQVFAHAWNPATKAMEEKAVAQYSYDKQGRLRAEWDPRIETSTACGKTCSALKTTYGYDAEGHVTALTPPGQESWALTYGTIAGDPNAGRLLKVTRAPASAGLWSGEAVKNSEAPVLAGLPAVGVRLAVSNGKWTNSPVVYAYQWEDCNSSGKECAPISGATNENYTPAGSDAGHTLVAEVTATNGGGSVVVPSAASALVRATAGSYTQTVDSNYSLNAVACVPGTTDCVLGDSNGKALYATNVSSTAAANWSSWSGPTGESPSRAVACPATSLCLLADGNVGGGGDGNLYYGTSLGGAWSTAFEPSYGVDALSCPSVSFCVDGQGEAGGYIRYSTTPASTAWTPEDIGGSTSITAVACLSSSFCAAGDDAGDVYIATTTSQVESPSWTSTNVDGTSALNGIACTSTSSCLAVDGAGNVINLTIESSGGASASKHDIDGTNSITAITCTGGSTCVAVDNAGNVIVSTNGGATWTKQYALGDKLTSVSCATSALCVTGDTAGNVSAFNAAGGAGSEGEYHAPQPGSTIEYRVPVSGEGAPHNMSKEEVEKWGQKDKSEYEDNDPVEATAIFSADEPQSWPATSYKRATISYMNGKGLTVNTAIPTGGITTSEYNELNETIRTLSADNQAAAMKEGCVSVAKKECKSAEVAEKWDAKSRYNGETAKEKEEEENTKGRSEKGARMLETIGPEHEVKLSTGEKVEARAVTHDYYDEGAKEAEEKNREVYQLVTKSTEGALLANGEEKDKHETVMSYGGQEDLGWTLRKPTAVTKEPGGLALTTTTVYDPATGDVVETTGAGKKAPPVYYMAQFGTHGTGNGQFEHPGDVALDSKGNIWVLDTESSRIEEFNERGEYLQKFGAAGSEGGQMSEPAAVAVDSKGNVWVADTSNSRIVEFNGEGGFEKAIGFGVSNGKEEFEICTAGCRKGTRGSGSGQFGLPEGIAVDANGNIWVADTYNGRIEELNEKGEYEKTVGSKGSEPGQIGEPEGLAAAHGDIWVADWSNNRVEQFTEGGKYVRELGSAGSGDGGLSRPYGVAVDASGHVWVDDTNNGRIEEFHEDGQYAGKFGSEGSGNGEFALGYPSGLAVNSRGEIWVADSGNSRVQQLEAAPEAPLYAGQFGKKGKGTGEFKEPTAATVASTGNLYVLDSGNARVEEFTAAGSYLGAFGAKGKGEGEFKTPSAMAEDPKGDLWVADTGNSRVEEFNAKNEYKAAFGKKGSKEGEFKEPGGVSVATGGNVFVADTGNNRVEKLKENGEFVAAFGYGVSNGKAEFEICTSTCEAGLAGSGSGQFDLPNSIAVSAQGVVWVADTANDRIEEFKESGEYLATVGSHGKGNGQFEDPSSITIDPAGNVWVTDAVLDRIQELTPSSSTFLATFGDKGAGNGQFSEPGGIAFMPNGAMYVADVKNNRVEKLTPASSPGTEGAHDTRTAYYTAKEESEAPACRNHPEWAGLPCQIEPAAQPGIGGSPELPVMTVTRYNMWDEKEVSKEEFGSGAKAVVREEIEAYDPAGRAVTSEEKATPLTDIKLSEVTDEYNAETGTLEKQSATINERTKTITSRDNTLGQQSEYSDAEGNVAKYTYEEGGDARLVEISEGKGKEAESTQTFLYNGTTGLMEKLVGTDAGMSAAQGTFTASYDVEGKMVGEVYPNGMCADAAYNAAGQTTSIEYLEPKKCTENKTVWFSDSVVPSIHGETLEQNSTLAKEKYVYDNDGRLLETEETPAGKNCRTRFYGYDEEGQRTSEAKIESESATCQTEDGLVQDHSYDAANRLVDPGVEYETFGNTTKMPAADAEHEIVSTYYVDNQVATQKQNEQADSYTYDPAGRTMETVSENEKTKAKTTVMAHYGGPGSTLAWTSEGSEKWTRNITGLDGALDAIQQAGKAPVLQLHDLEGDIVGTVGDSEAEVTLVTTYNSTEFGVPSEGKAPPKYAWLGASGAASEPAQGAGASAQSGASYVPEVARLLQTSPTVPPGAFPNGSPGTQDTATVSAAALAYSQEMATEKWQHAEMERQRARAGEVEFRAGDPPHSRWFGQTGEVTIEALYGHLRACYGDSAYFDAHAMQVAECVVSNAHFYLGFLFLETYWYHPEKAIVEHYGLNTVLMWGNDVTQGLGECIAAIGEYSGGRLMCEVEDDLQEEWVMPAPPETAVDMGESEAAELKKEGELPIPDITMGIVYSSPPVVSLCRSGESQCAPIP